MNDLRYLKAKDTFLDRAYLALKNHFASRDDFDKYFDAIKRDEQKDLFLRTSLFYVLLVKCGDWVVDVPGSDKVVDYLTNTYKFVTIFSLIESLSEETRLAASAIWPSEHAIPRHWPCWGKGAHVQP